MFSFNPTFDPKPVQVRRLEVVPGVSGRRRWSPDDKARIVEETLAPGATVSEVARRHDIRPEQLFGWRREMRIEDSAPRVDFVPVLVEAAEPEKAERPQCGPPRAGRGDIELEFEGALHLIGEDRAERLDIIPAQLRVLVVRRPKYACRACEDVVIQAPAPARLIEGGIPTEATVAHVVVAKYADHLPLYRQAQIYARQGIQLDRSTLADWTGRAAFLLRPVHEHLFKTLGASSKLFADETTAPVLDPGRGRTKTGQLWAYARDDRPWGGSDPPAVAYAYAPDRKAERPMAHLAGFKGVLQVDGYGGYLPLAEQGQVRLAFCWAHVRRKFYKLAAAGPAPIATEALVRIKPLYAIQVEIRGKDPDVGRAIRQEKSRPLIEALEPWLRAKLETISQKTKLAEAIRYALSRWAGLSPFLDDGHIEIDNNTVERAIRAPALNRKNALFAGSDGGAEHWAVLATLIETAKLNDLDPEAYLAHVITRIVGGHPQSQISALMPWAHADTVAGVT